MQLPTVFMKPLAIVLLSRSILKKRLGYVSYLCIVKDSQANNAKQCLEKAEKDMAVAFPPKNGLTE